MLIAPNIFIDLGNAMLDNADVAIRTQDRRSRAHFGASRQTMSDTWDRLHVQGAHPPGGRPSHLLWASLSLKLHDSESVLCGVAHCRDEKTSRKWVWLHVHAIQTLMPTLICFNDRLPANWQAVRFKCWMSVDGTDFRINGPKPFGPRLKSHKSNGPGLRYEVGLCIRTGLIVWTNGPFRAGGNSDLGIFQRGLRHRLVPGEKAIADGTYKDALCIRKCPYDHPLIKQWKGEVRA